MASKQSSSLYLFSPKQGEAENSKLDEDLGELWRDLFCLFCFVANDDYILIPLFPNAARALDENICGTARARKTR